MSLFLSIISSGEITNYINLALLVVAAVGLFGFIIGLIKGFWVQTFNLVCTIILFIGMIFLLKPISNWLYNLDIVNLLSGLNVSLPSEDIRSIGDFIEYNIITALQSSGLDYSNAEIIAFASGVCLSFIRFILYFVLLFLIIFLGAILIPIIYLVFRLIIPKTLRKKKLRLLGGLSGFVEFVIIFCMFINPLTALVNSTVGKIRDENGNIVKNEEINNETYDLVYNALEGYNNSFIAKALFAFSKDGQSLDYKIMDYVTTTKVGEGMNLHVYNEIGEALSIVYDAISTGAIDMSTMAVNYDILVSSQFIKNTLYSLSESTIVLFALPIIVSASLGASGNNSDVDLSDIDLSNVDWSESIKAVGDVFESIKSTGYVQIALSSPDDMLNQIILNEKNKLYLQEAMIRFGDSSFVSTLLPQMAVSYFKAMKNSATSDADTVTLKNKKMLEEDSSPSFNYGSIFADLPDEAYQVETYQNISWGKELSSIVGIMFDMADQIKSVTGKQEISVQELMDTINDADPLKMFIGIDDSITYTSKEEFKNNVFINGGQYNGVEIPGTKAILGIKDGDSNVGLLNLQTSKLLFEEFGLMSSFVKTVFSSLLNQDDSILSSIDDDLSKLTFNGWKNELVALLNLSVALVVASDSISSSEDVLSTIGDKNNETNIAFTFILDNMEDSIILNNVAPKVIENMLSDDKDTKIFLNLTIGDLNFTQFEDSNFSREFRYLINDVIPEANEILNSGTFGIEYVVNNSDKVASLLESIYISQILNSSIVEPGQNSNFENIMISLFSPVSEGGDEEMGISKQTDHLFEVSSSLILNVDDDKDHVLSNGWVHKDSLGESDGEINALFDVIASLKSDEEGKDEYLYQALTTGSNVSDNVFKMGNEIRRIFPKIDQSYLMKNSLPNTFDEIFKDGDSQLNAYIDFSELTDFTNEGTHLADTLDSLDEISQTNPNASIIDMIKESDSDLKKEFEYTGDKDYVDYFIENSKTYNLLNSMLQTQSIKASELLYDSIRSVFDINKNGSDGQLVPDDVLDDAKEDFEFKQLAPEDAIKYNSSIIVSWEGSFQDGYYGETYYISRLMLFSDTLNSLNGKDSNEFDEALELIVSSYPLRKMVGPIITNTLANISDTSSDSIKQILSKDYCDYEVFDRLSIGKDNVENRFKEIGLRKIETDAISALYKSLGDLDTFDDVLSLTIGEENSTLCNLLFKLHDSELFNSSVFISENNGTSRIRITSFENTFNVILGMQSDRYAPLKNSDLYVLNNKEENDRWVISLLVDGNEIIKFNNTIKAMSESWISDPSLIDSYVVRQSVINFAEGSI